MSNFFSSASLDDVVVLVNPQRFELHVFQHARVAFDLLRFACVLATSSRLR